MRALILATAAAATASNESAWRERLGLAGSACPAECPLRHTSEGNCKAWPTRVSKCGDMCAGYLCWAAGRPCCPRRSRPT